MYQHFIYLASFKNERLYKVNVPSKSFIFNAIVNTFVINLSKVLFNVEIT